MAINSYGRLDVLVTGALCVVDGGITIAKGPVGNETPWWLRSQPEGDLRLDHSHEGLEGKNPHAVK
jgi:hypothetical protein